MDEILVSTQATLEQRLYDVNGTLVNSEAGTVTLTIKDPTGTEIAGSPFTVTNPPASTGIYTRNVTISQTGVYTTSWAFPGTTGTRTGSIEVVGGFLFTVADLKAFDSALASYTATQIREARGVVQELFESPKVTNRAFRPRGNRVLFDGDGSSILFLPSTDVRSVHKFVIGGTTIADLDADGIEIYSSGKVTWQLWMSTPVPQ